MYLEKINGYTYLTIKDNLVKKQIENVVSNLLGWVAAGIAVVALTGAIYCGNLAYQCLTTLF